MPFREKTCFVFIICLSATLLLAGCSWLNRAPGAPDQAPPPNQQQEVMQNFTALTQKLDVPPRDVIAFIKGNIAQVSPDNALTMLLKLETLQKQRLDSLQMRYNDDAVQRKLVAQFPRGFDAGGVNEIADAPLKDLVNGTFSDGFKLETAEGTYFPVIDYGAYRQFLPAVTPDIAAYFGIMANESDKVAAKDAALVIGWDEVVNRALTAEKFIRDYPQSAKLADVKQFYKRYAIYTFYGANNTPLFQYDTKTIVPEALKNYQRALAKDGDSQYLAQLKTFLDIVAKSGNKLTPEVEQYRKSIAPVGS